MELKIATLLLLSIVDLFFGLFVYLSNRKSPVNLFYGLAVLAVGLWSFGVFMFFWSDISSLRFWSNFLYFTGSLIVSNFFAFSLIFPKEVWKWTPFRTIAIYLPNIFLGAAIFLSDFIIKEVVVSSSGSRIISFGGLYFLYWLYFLVFLSNAFIILMRRYFRAEGMERLQVGYVLVGSLILAAFGTLTNLWLPTLGIFDLFWLGPYFSIFLVTLLATAIFKYRLFNIRIISAEIFIALLVVALFVNFFTSVSPVSYLFNGTILAGSIVFGYFLIHGIFNEIRSREEIQRLAESLKKANEELKKLDQLKSEFLSLATHQLRTPLSIIKGYISMVQEGTFGPISEKVRDVLRKVYFSNERLINVVADFLNLSRIESGRMQYEFEVVQIEEMIGNIVDEFKVAAKEKSLDFIWERPQKKMPLVYIDKEKFRQVLLNLIDNALHYTHVGFIKFKVEEEITERKRNILISVQDTGVGLTREELESIFKRFSRGEAGSKVYTGGLGLGLYLAKRIVSDHGGEIWAESKGHGQGAAFFVRLPARGVEVQRVPEFKEFASKI